MTEVATTDRWLRLLGSLASAFMLVVLAACGGGGTGSTAPQTQTQSLTISPATVGIEYGASPVTFVVAGGVKPYALTSSNQALLPVGGVGDDGRFQLTPAFAPDIATPVVVTVRDALQATVTAQVTVAARLGGPLAVSPTSAEAAVGVPVTFTISGGSTPYSVTSSAPSIVPNPIAVDAAGHFTVTPTSNPPANATVTLTVRDGRNATVNATLTVTSLALAVNPSTVQAGPNQPVTFTISGGQAPYTVTSSQPAIVPNPTSIDAQGRLTLRAIVTPTTVTPV